MQTRSFLLLVLSLGFIPSRAFSAIDAPGVVVFHWLADEENVLEDFPAPGALPSVEAEAYLNSYASVFGEMGVFIWAGFALDSPDGPRTGMLLLDLDLSRDGRSSLPDSAIRAEYLEKRGDEFLFEGAVVQGEVRIIDVLFSEDDQGAVEGSFDLIFGNPSGQVPGCRVFVQGSFVTRPSPARLREAYGVAPNETVTYTDTSCGGAVYVADDTGEGCDCGGDTSDPDAGGCEGDTSGSGGEGCEGDSGGEGCEGDSGGEGCEGDSGGGSDCAGDSGGGGGCEGGGGGGACEARAAVGGSRSKSSRAIPLHGLMRFFPELSTLLFIVWMKRRQRR